MEKGFVFFKDFVFRTPLYYYDREGMKSKMQDISFDEAVFLASPEFRKEKQKAAESGKSDHKVEMSLYKYLTRATTRCTPFGMFAGCSVGHFGDCGEKEGITLVERDSYKRTTRLDMNYLCALVQSLEQRPEIRERIKYYPNDSIYTLGGRLRYIEYYYSGTRRVHRISSAEPDDYLTGILEFAAQGRTIDDMAQSLVDDDIDTAEARDYIEELISSQLLKSELEVCVTGDDALRRLISQLRGIYGTNDLVEKLHTIYCLLKLIDASPPGMSSNVYAAITSMIGDLGVKYEPKYLFQTDMFKPSESGCLPDRIMERLPALIDFMSRMTASTTQGNIADFRKAFHERFEEREMPLLEVLDTELGVGFAQRGPADVPNELIKGLVYKANKARPNTQPETRLSRFETVILRKYIDYVGSGADRIVLEDADLGSRPTYLDDLPATMSVTCSLMGDKLHVRHVGGSCGANLLGRFCHLDPSIEDFSRQITDIDGRLHPDAILAEIVHLPESRIGNILFRPVLREHEIHYLARPAVEGDFAIPLSDLMVSVNGERVTLRSRRLDREVIPRLTNAHNFAMNALPAYQFLCELQTQNMRGGLFFSWGSALSDLEFRPRVEYGEFILSRAQWLVKEESFPKLDGEIAAYLDERHISARVLIPEGDNEQYIDFHDPMGVELFRNMLKKRKALWVEEFLFDAQAPSPIVDPSGNPFCNEFVFVCHKAV